MNSDDQLKIWRALSELFLDTEIENHTFRYIARVVSEVGLSLSGAEEILWYEVFPVLEHNLQSLAGVWDGWTDTWLSQNMPAPIRPSAIQGKTSIIKEVKQHWQHVVAAYEKQHH